jgi:hypothetical protein
MDSKLARRILWAAKYRAKRDGLNFDLVLSDIHIPTHCPVLGLPLQGKTGTKGPSDNSPTLDRIRPGLGYIKGNVMVISNLANRLKSDADVEHLEKLAGFYRQLLK